MRFGDVPAVFCGKMQLFEIYKHATLVSDKFILGFVLSGISNEPSATGWLNLVKRVRIASHKFPEGIQQEGEIHLLSFLTTALDG